ncbi:response regulator [Coraliomargarita algicola]|uniref:Response regulator n=1 Tax=Coraliomargarita algicola TaxID=3092156 RepID=A0ABZ0RJT4_9BACT|nr:response regulator [Coraliomargarita sp. J2-16]WPJ95436.1 response regulator [Coraliomargarita sp. J2-16]
MNVLFIEDEKELAAMGAAQLEMKGFTVFLASDLAAARAILEDRARTVHFVISDHRLPDGFGVDFMIEIHGKFSQGKCAVVSGCLTAQDIERLEAHEIPYYHKPLLYGNLIDDLRRKHAARAAIPVPAPVPAEPTATAQVATPEVGQASAGAELNEATRPATKRKRYKIWPF